MSSTEKLGLISNIAASYLRRNPIAVDQITTVIGAVTQAVQAAEKILGGVVEAEPQAAVETKPVPATTVRKSVQPDFLVCLDCGARQTTLKRHIQTAHGLTPRDYRLKWDLPRDYPMTAPSYSEKRSALAKQLGLGNRGRGRPAAAVIPPPPVKRGRRPKTTDATA